MRVAVVLDHRFWSSPDGHIWTDGPFPYSFFTRYLDVFDSVKVVARTATAPGPSSRWVQANGAGVEFAAIPCYIGPLDYFKRCLAVTKSIQNALAEVEIVILRAPGQLANVAASHLIAKDRPYGAEVVGDPYDAFAPGSDRHALRPFFRWQQTHALGKLCRRASTTAYVTEFALQQRYPCSPQAFTTHYSSVELPEEAFVEHAPEPRTMKQLHLITVGSLEHLYKGQDILLRALASCRQACLDLRLTIVGDGRKRLWLEELIKLLELTGVVRFAGQMPSGPAIREELDQADLFILPSRQEGVPRAMIEAMARGLPCIGSTVGGIPELLPESAIVPPGDSTALAAVISRFLSVKVRQEAGIRNLEAARAYGDRELRSRRREFYLRTARQAALQ